MQSQIIPWSGCVCKITLLDGEDIYKQPLHSEVEVHPLSLCFGVEVHPLSLCSRVEVHSFLIHSGVEVHAQFLLSTEWM